MTLDSASISDIKYIMTHDKCMQLHIRSEVG